MIALQADLAALEHLDDEGLWEVARSQQRESVMDRHEDLLYKNANDTLTAAERNELTQLRHEADRLMLRKAHAAVLLISRGYKLPPSDQL